MYINTHAETPTRHQFDLVRHANAIIWQTWTQEERSSYSVLTRPSSLGCDARKGRFQVLRVTSCVHHHTPYQTVQGSVVCPLSEGGGKK